MELFEQEIEYVHKYDRKGYLKRQRCFKKGANRNGKWIKEFDAMNLMK